MRRVLPLSALLLLLVFSNTIIAQKDAASTKQFLKADPSVKTFEVNERTGTPSFISFRDAAALISSDAGAIIKKYFDLDRPGNTLQSKDVTATKTGVQVEKMKLYYEGIPVEHSAYSVLSREGKIISITAESYALDAAFNSTPSLTKESALQKALAFVNAKKYAWEALSEDQQKVTGNTSFQQQLEQLRQQFYPIGELVIARNVYGDGKPRLAWKFDIYATEPLSRSYIYIDAADGKLLLRDIVIKHVDEKQKHIAAVTQANANGPSTLLTGIHKNFTGTPDRVTASELGVAHTRYSGIRNIYTTRISVPTLGTPDPNFPSATLSYSGTDPRVPIVLPEQVFILKDDTRGNGVETYDMNGVGGLPLSLPGLHAQSLAFVDRNVLAGSQNVWRNEAAAGTLEDHVRGATSNGTIGTDEASNDDIALDAHWGAEMVYDYWKASHNRFSFDNKNTAIKSYIHYGPAYDNAFWNGSVMTYGDGSGTSLPIGFKPLTSLDVCGHEIGHGICSFTSNLVYESESGAMNEALSDIWAASIERFVITQVDPSLAAVYKPFFIGEQISANPLSPLRRMDAPKDQSNPDTYGGENWVNPVCTPTLVNDECGVHTNSGVLNKWFYLLTAGSGNGSGPDATYVIPGADDQLRDNGAVINSIPYSVTGIGFDKSEMITYLMELMLTPNATYAQARTASITAAQILYGECSAEEISTTNAWNAVGVGAAYAGCTAPLISASALLSDVRETAGGTDCVRYNEYNININLTSPSATPVLVNLSVGATDMSADEYSLSATSVTYNIGETGLRTVKLRIYDDAMVENDESITINATSVLPVLNQSLTFTIRNDDVNPTLGGIVTLLNENFESTATNTVPAGWTTVEKITPSSVKWEVETYTSGVLNWTGKRAIIELTATSPTTDGIAAYSVLPGDAAQVILKTPMINATGLNRVRVQFVFSAMGEPACEPACDYGQLVYSFDGNTFAPFTDSAAVMYLQPTDANYDYTLPASFNGKQFYLGVLWNNDDNAGTATSITVDNFVITGRGNDLESELGDAVSEKVNAETGKPSYFYSTADGELIASITNSTAHNYGCVTTTIEKAGNLGFDWYIEGINKHRVADKIVRVTPDTNNPIGAYSITLYFTEAQILALEAYTGLTRTNFYIYKTSAANYTGANAGNTQKQPATYTALPGLGGQFSASFSTGFSAFALGAQVSVVLPISCIDFKAIKNNRDINLQWKVGQDNGNDHFDLERSLDGITYYPIATVAASAGNAGVYQFTDQSVTAAREVYYRLKQTDISGASRYICTILKVTTDGGGFTIGAIYPNPGSEQPSVNVFTDKAMKLRIEYNNVAGQALNRQEQQLLPGATRIMLNLKNIPTGTYMVRFLNENGQVLGVQTYLRQ